MKDKSSEKIPDTKIYLASPFFNDKQKKRINKAKKLLSENKTVSVIHFPFDFQYKDANVEDPNNDIFGSQVWIDSTYENDISAMTTSDAGVFLYDLDREDSGSAFELGFLRALHKPAIIVLFGKDTRNTPVNLMIAGGGTRFFHGDTEFNKLAKYNFNHFPSDKDFNFKVF